MFKQLKLSTIIKKAAFLACAMPLVAMAQEWPNKPITFVVPFPAGGGTDAFARPLATQLTKQLGKQIIIDNRGGAGGTLGASIAAKAAPDGYSFFVGAAHHAIAPAMYPNLDYDIEKSFIPVAMIANPPQVIVVNPKNVQVKDLKEFIALLKKNPGKFNYASAGNGSTHHLAGEQFKMLTKTFITHIPYRGAGPAMTDLLGGQVDMMFATAAAVAPHIASGKLRALAVTSAERSSAMKSIPAIAETVKGYSVESWYGLFAPAGTPADVIAKLNAAAKQSTQTVEFRRKLEPEGLAVSTGTPQELDTYVKREEARWRKIVKENNIKPD